MSEPIVVEGAVVRVGAGVGMASAAECIGGDDLLSRADQAMFTIKRARRSTPTARPEKPYSTI